MTTKTFRHFGLTLAAALVLTACGGSDPKASPAKAEAKTDAPKAGAGSVNVYNWVEYIPEKLKPDFEIEVINKKDILMQLDKLGVNLMTIYNDYYQKLKVGE